MVTTHGELNLNTRVQDDVLCVMLYACKNMSDDTEERTLSVEVWDEVDKDSEKPLWENVYYTRADLSSGVLKSDLIGQGVNNETAAEAVRTVSVLFDHLGKIQKALRLPT